MAEQLGSGLQNRVDRCNSGSRLDFPILGEWWNGIHDRLKICWASAHEGSTPSSPRIFEILGQLASACCFAAGRIRPSAKPKADSFRHRAWRTRHDLWRGLERAPLKHRRPSAVALMADVSLRMN